MFLKFIRKYRNEILIVIAGVTGFTALLYIIPVLRSL